MRYLPNCDAIVFVTPARGGFSHAEVSGYLGRIRQLRRNLAAAGDAGGEGLLDGTDGMHATAKLDDGEATALAAGLAGTQWDAKELVVSSLPALAAAGAAVLLGLTGIGAIVALVLGALGAGAIASERADRRVRQAVAEQFADRLRTSAAKSGRAVAANLTKRLGTLRDELAAALDRENAALSADVEAALATLEKDTDELAARRADLDLAERHLAAAAHRLDAFLVSLR